MSGHKQDAPRINKRLHALQSSTKELLTIKDVTQVMGVQTITVHNWRKYGRVCSREGAGRRAKLKYLITAAGARHRVFIRKNDLIDFAQATGLIS